MSDFPDYVMPPPPVLTPFHPDSLGLTLAGAGQGSMSTANFASGAWPANNKAFFYPFTLTDHAIARQLLFFVGGTSSGNIDVGIYDQQKNLVVSSGSTAMSATIDTLQELNITDTPLRPGTYLLAAACSTTAGTVWRYSLGGDEAALPVFPLYEQASALPLPDPCVPVISTEATTGWVAGIGVQFASVF